MLSVLNQWNRWGKANLASGYKRDIVQTMQPFLQTKEVVSLIGLRRAGKTTVLYQIMDCLVTQGVPEKAILHVNFEEPALGPSLGLETLESLYQTYREQVYPSGKAYLFFDEIQNVPAWEKWVRARNESEDIKVFITGSSANLMSREFSTLLTGRHVEFYISPLTFIEYLRVKSIALPDTTLNISAPPEVAHALLQYMTWGGFPEVALSEEDARKHLLLKQYFDDILFKDVAMRHQVRDIVLLRNLAVHLLTQTACLISLNRLANIFGVSLETVSHYCQFIQEAFLVDYLSFFSLKTAERNRQPQKVHVCDMGLRNIVSMSTSPDYGKLAESAVYSHLQQYYRGGIFYWKAEQELDFIVQQGNEITHIVQVAYEVGAHATLARELSSLAAGKLKFPKADAKLIVGKLPDAPIPATTTLLPLWRFLCTPA